MSLNSRSQENAAPARWPRAVTNRYSRELPNNPSIDTVASYCSQLIIETTTAAAAASATAATTATNIDAFLARSPLQMANIAFSRYQHQPGSRLCSDVVASITLPSAFQLYMARPRSGCTSSNSVSISISVTITSTITIIMANSNPLPHLTFHHTHTLATKFSQLYGCALCSAY
ncbi:hypothetical protein ACLKA7_013514 [Drosophila subpalustris]